MGEDSSCCEGEGGGGRKVPHPWPYVEKRSPIVYDVGYNYCNNSCAAAAVTDTKFICVCIITYVYGLRPT